MSEPSELYPKNTNGVLDLAFQSIPSTASGLDAGVIWPYTQNNVFRTGQKLLLHLGIDLPIAGDGNYQTQVQLKPWWARANLEKRQAFGGNGSPVGSPGEPQTFPVDRLVFGNGALANPLQDNRYVWVPSPKVLLVSEYSAVGPPPAPAAARHVKSTYVDDVWTFDLPDPSTIAAKFGANQQPSRWITIPYPAYGYALGFTYLQTLNDPEGTAIPVSINLTWQSLGYGDMPNGAPWLPIG